MSLSKPQDHLAPPTEDSLLVSRVPGTGPNTFTNTHPLWHPPGSRGLFGGCLIAQCLTSAQKTVPEYFVPHSMHCSFLVSGSASTNVVYAVERVRDGKNFATRLVRATQEGSCLFVTTIGFTRDDGGEVEGEGKKVVRHAKGMSEQVGAPNIEDQMSEVDPMILCTPEVVGRKKEAAYRKVRWWVRARGSIQGSGEDGRQRHVAAVAFMTDNMFIEAVALVHGLIRPWRESSNSSKPDFKIQRTERGEEGGLPPVGMMVSLSHTIHFHESRGFRADDWLLLESNSPWAAHERGFVTQRVYSKDGKLIASCYQEGLVRLMQDEGTEASKSAKL